MWIKLALFIVVLAASSADDAADPLMLRNAMEHLLQIRAPEFVSSRVKREEDPSSPHLYMMELYEKYLTSDSMKTRSNTIRSLTPQRGTEKCNVSPVRFLRRRINGHLTSRPGALELCCR